MIKVAFATTDGVHVDEHFGWAARFDVYEVSPAGFRLADSRCVGSIGRDEDGKVEARVAAVQDCAIVCVTSIGPTAAARVVRARIHPVRVKDGQEIDAFLDRLRLVVAGRPPRWLGKLDGGYVAESAHVGGRDVAAPPRDTSGE